MRAIYSMCFVNGTHSGGCVFWVSCTTILMCRLCCGICGNIPHIIVEYCIL